MDMMILLENILDHIKRVWRLVSGALLVHFIPKTSRIRRKTRIKHPENGLKIPKNTPKKPATVEYE